MDKFTAADVLNDDINVVGGEGEVKSDVTITVVVDVTTGDDVDEDNIIFWQKSWQSSMDLKLFSLPWHPEYVNDSQPPVLGLKKYLVNRLLQWPGSWGMAQTSWSSLTPGDVEDEVTVLPDPVQMLTQLSSVRWLFRFPPQPLQSN